MQLDLFNLIDTGGKATGGQGPAAAPADPGDHGEEFSQMLGLAIGALTQVGGKVLQPVAEGTAGQPQPDGVRQNTAAGELAALRGWNLASPVVVTDEQPAVPAASGVSQVNQHSPLIVTDDQAVIPAASGVPLATTQTPTAPGYAGTRLGADPAVKMDLGGIAGAVPPADAGSSGAFLNFPTPGAEPLTIVPGRSLPQPDKQPQYSLAPSVEPGPNALDGRPSVREAQPPGWQATAPHVPGGRPVPEAVRLPATADVAPDRPEGRPVAATAPVPAPGSRKLQSLDGRPVVHPPSPAAVDPDHPGSPASPDRPEPVPEPKADQFPDPKAPPAALAGTPQTAVQATVAAIRAFTAGPPLASGDPASPASPVPGSDVSRPAGTAMTSSVSGTAEVRAVPQQVVRGILEQVHFGRGEQRLTLQLDPEHLGRVEVRLVATADRLEIVIQTESALASQALRENVHDLIRALSGRFEGRWQQVDVKVQEPATVDRHNRDPEGRDQEETRDQDRSRDQQQDRGQQHPGPELGRQSPPQH